MNEETIVQSGSSATVQEAVEAYNSFMESINDGTGDEISLGLSEEEQAILDQAVEDAHQEIPTNSATLLVDEATSRFSSAIWYENIQKKTVILAGVGGIGRFGNFINF